MNPSENNFALQEGSSCIGSGLDNYDIGGVIYTDLPQMPFLLEITETEIKGDVRLRWINPFLTVHGDILDTLSAVKIWRDDVLIAASDQVSIGDTLELIDIVEKPDFYRYRMCVVDTNNIPGKILSTPISQYGGEIEGIIVWELDRQPISGQSIEAIVDTMDYDKYVYVTSASGKYELNEHIDAVFVCLGIYSDNHILSETEGYMLENYLDNGGNVYMEGGDTWYYDAPSPVHAYFHITGVADGSADLSSVVGAEGTAFNGLELGYAGANNWIDHLDDGSGAEVILNNKTPLYGVGVAYNSGMYRTIGTSFQFGGLTDGDGQNTKAELLSRIMNFFGLGPVNINEATDGLPEKYSLSQNYPNPFNPSTQINYQLKKKSEVELSIYNSMGQRIRSLANGVQSAGSYTATWDGKNENGISMPTGIYFIRMKAGAFVQTRRMVLMK